MVQLEAGVNRVPRSGVGLWLIFPTTLGGNKRPKPTLRVVRVVKKGPYFSQFITGHSFTVIFDLNDQQFSLTCSLRKKLIKVAPARNRFCAKSNRCSEKSFKTSPDFDQKSQGENKTFLLYSAILALLHLLVVFDNLRYLSGDNVRSLRRPAREDVAPIQRVTINENLHCR